MQFLDPAYKTMISIETLRMPIAEISNRLIALVGEESYFEFSPINNKEFVSNKYDIRAIRFGTECKFEVAEPECGQPNLSVVPRRDNVRTRETIAVIWEAAQWRKQLMSTVINSVFQLNSSCVEPRANLRIPEIAKHCELHVMIVASVIHNKNLQVDSGSIRCSDFLMGYQAT